MSNLSLPKELERFRKDIEATLKPTIKLIPALESTTCCQSKFSGFPYLPKNAELPKDASGKTMKLLAQINFEELPGRLENFPDKGILQFFLAAEDDVMGLDFDDQTSQSNFKVIYHPELLTEDQLVTDFSFVEETGDEYFPLTNELALSFIPVQEAVSIADYSFEDFFEGIDLDEVVKDEDGDEVTLWDIYADNLGNEGHKIGGYAFFTQSDPREDEAYENHRVLLLQIDSDDEAGIMWGDVGVANFFITEEDLKNRDFSNILYNWDCH